MIISNRVGDSPEEYTPGGLISYRKNTMNSLISYRQNTMLGCSHAAHSDNLHLLFIILYILVFESKFEICSYEIGSASAILVLCRVEA